MGVSGSESGGRLPLVPLDFRRELLRRLELQEREVRALVEPGDPHAFQGVVEELRAMEKEIRVRLAGEETGGPEWPERRAEIIGIWRRHRRLFEQLATECHQEHPARPGSRDSGPRW